MSIHVKTIDRYGRTVAGVISEININLAMVEDGQSFAYRQYLSGCDAREYLDAECRAQELLRQGHSYLDGNGDGHSSRPHMCQRKNRRQNFSRAGTSRESAPRNSAKSDVFGN